MDISREMSVQGTKTTPNAALRNMKNDSCSTEVMQSIASDLDISPLEMDDRSESEGLKDKQSSVPNAGPLAAAR